MKNAWDYVLITETIPDITKLDEYVTTKLTASLGEIIREGEAVDSPVEFEIVSHSVTHVNGSLMLSVLFRRPRVGSRT